jgi:hypothetical protein
LNAQFLSEDDSEVLIVTDRSHISRQLFGELRWVTDPSILFAMVFDLLF